MMMKIVFSFAMMVAWVSVATAQTQLGPWAGKKVAFLGDSITDPAQTNIPQRVFWQYLADDVGLKSYVYAVSGYQ